MNNPTLYWQCKPGIGLIRCVPDARYRKFSPRIRAYYSPVLMVEDEAVRKDAERYRWLRSQHWSESEIAVVSFPKKSVKLGSDCPTDHRLDDAIDAVMGRTSAHE